VNGGTLPIFFGEFWETSEAKMSCVNALIPFFGVTGRPLKTGLYNFALQDLIVHDEL